MEALAVAKNVRISAFKAREVSRLIQGLDYQEALNVATFTNKKAARLIRKVLVSAHANAVNNHDLSSDKLIVKLAAIGEGPTMKRFRPKARGMAGSILKRTSHIKIILAERED